VGFQTWLQNFERGVSGLSNSTGNMMREMVLKGPSSYDALIVYESVAIDYLKNAEGRWGQLHVVYPEFNAWNDNPYYIIDAPWSSKSQRKAAETFLQFLLSEPIQKESLTHGFRPANPSVPVKFADSPFVKYADYGIRVDLGKICDPPRGEVVNNLLQSWQRSQGNR
jgi:ABC-type sulfate transport system substrate-binding protein